MKVIIALALASIALVNGQTATECVGTVANTLGTCDCNNQVFVGNGCNQVSKKIFHWQLTKDNMEHIC